MFAILVATAVTVLMHFGVHVTTFTDSPTHGFMVGTDSAYCTVQADQTAPGAGIYCQIGN